MAHRIEWRPSAVSDLTRLGHETRRRVVRRVERLGSDRRPAGVRPLQGGAVGLLRVREGDFRIVYVVDDDLLRVVVVRVGHRSDVYRGGV